MLTSILRSLPTARQGRRGRATRRAFRPDLSASQLEGRSLLSTLTVTSLADSGAGTLRAAVDFANTDSGPHTIVFDPSLAGGSIALKSQLNVFGHNLVIKGNGSPMHSNSITIGGQNASRLFYVNGVDLTIDDLTLTDGFADMGAAVLAYRGTLSMTGDIIGNCYTTATDGGAVAVNNEFAVYNNDTFINNVAEGCGGAAVNHTSTVYYQTCSFLNNEAGRRAGVGGAIFDRGGAEYTIMSNCDFEHNIGRDGGAVYNQSYLLLENCLFEYDTADRFGGAVESDGTYGTNPSTNIRSCAFDQCSAGGTVFKGYGGALFATYNANVNGCTFFNNYAIANGNGAAIAYLPFALNLTPDNKFTGNAPDDTYQKPDTSTIFA